MGLGGPSRVASGGVGRLKHVDVLGGLNLGMDLTVVRGGGWSRTCEASLLSLTVARLTRWERGGVPETPLLVHKILHSKLTFAIMLCF